MTRIAHPSYMGYYTGMVSRTALLPAALFFVFFAAWTALFLALQPMALTPPQLPTPSPKEMPLVGKGVLPGGALPLTDTEMLTVPEGFLGIVFTDALPWRAGIFTLPEGGDPKPLLLVAVRGADEPPLSLSPSDAALAEGLTVRRTIALRGRARADFWIAPSFFRTRFAALVASWEEAQP